MNCVVASTPVDRPTALRIARAARECVIKVLGAHDDATAVSIWQAWLSQHCDDYYKYRGKDDYVDNAVRDFRTAENRSR